MAVEACDPDRRSSNTNFAGILDTIVVKVVPDSVTNDTGGQHLKDLDGDDGIGGDARNAGLPLATATLVVCPNPTAVLVHVNVTEPPAARLFPGSAVANAVSHAGATASPSEIPDTVTELGLLTLICHVGIVPSGSNTESLKELPSDTSSSIPDARWGLAVD